MSKKNKSKKNKCKSHVQRDCEVLKEDKNDVKDNDFICDLCGCNGADRLSAENDKNNNSVSKESSDDETVKLCKMCMVRHSHAGKSLPWTISNIDGYGKCLVSTRTIKPLEVVVADTAVLTAPISKMSCCGCGRAVNCLFKCNQCNLPLCGKKMSKIKESPS